MRKEIGFCLVKARMVLCMQLETKILRSALPSKKSLRNIQSTLVFFNVLLLLKCGLKLNTAMADITVNPQGYWHTSLPIVAIPFFV